MDTLWIKHVKYIVPKGYENARWCVLPDGDVMMAHPDLPPVRVTPLRLDRRPKLIGVKK